MLIEYKERVVYYKGTEVELEAGYFDKDYTIFNRNLKIQKTIKEV